MNIKKMPIIGTVRTKELKYSTGDKTHVVPSETYSVVGIQEINGEKAYITDVWYKEYKQVPLIIIEGIVDEFIPQANVGYILLAEKLKNIAPKTFDAADEKIASRVRERRFDNGGLIAPNGKPSNLTAHQYEVVRTPEFKAWFGDWENDLANSSKVIDENGEPKVMYHGTTKDFSIFERTSGEFGGGIYFGSNYDANYFANVSAGHTPLSQQNIIPVFLNIRNPYNYRKATATKPMPTRSSLMKKGFDGVFGFTLNDTLEVVAYDSNQIKSALSNMTFDSANPDIRYEEGGYLHGSPHDFCDTGFKLGAGKGQGENLWGTGHYFTQDKDLATYYAKFIVSDDVDLKIQQKVADKLGFKTYNDIPFDYEKRGVKSKYGMVLKLDLYNQYLKEYVDKHKGNGVVYEVTLFPGKDKKDYKIIDFSGENYTDNEVIKKDKQDLKNLINTLSKNKRKYTKAVKLFFDKKGWEFSLEKYSKKFTDTLKRMKEYYKNFESYSYSTPLLYNLGYDIKKLFQPRYFDYAKDYKVIYDKITDQQKKDLSNEEAYYKGVLFTEFIKDAGYDALKYYYQPSLVPYKKENEHDAIAIVVFDDENVEIDNCKVAEDGMMMAKNGRQTKLKATGDCYVVALEFTMGFLSPYKGKYVGTPYIVHGEVQGQGQISNIRYGHAWVEDDANVYDFSNNRQMIVPKMIYYMIGNINPDDPKKYRKYTFAEARRKSIETGIYGPWEIETEYRDGGQLSPDDKKEIFKKWRSLVNMSKTELERFYNSEEGKEAGLSAGEAKSAGIDSGRESARWIMKMKDTPVSEWTPAMWKWAKKQISFISRMRGNKGSLYDDKGRKTRKHTSLLIWGHNPKK